MTDLVWYVAYGSNLAADRLQAYLSGGRAPAQRSGSAHPGARDPAPPRASQLTHVRHPLVFAGSSRRWGGGGVAFLDPQATATTPCRAWLVTTAQFADIYAQENGLVPSDDVDRALNEGGLTEGWYRQVLDLGWLDDYPMRSFTHPWPSRLGLRAPSASYLGTINQGRAELGLPPLEVGSTPRPSGRDGSTYDS